jgi:hypothetical protein
LERLFGGRVESKTFIFYFNSSSVALEMSTFCKKDSVCPYFFKNNFFHPSKKNLLILCLFLRKNEEKTEKVEELTISMKELKKALKNILKENEGSLTIKGLFKELKTKHDKNTKITIS